MRFNVWAPRAEQVALKIGEQRIPMLSLDQGWWSQEVADAIPGDDYTFLLDESQPLPDPRSPWQPYGVHGPSRLLDQTAFRWSDQGWRAPPLASAIIYELHVGTFTPQGTFGAAIHYLDHLVELGITHLELMPVSEFPGDRGWGYDGVNLYAPHHSYGGPQGLKRLVNACHAKGLAILLDVVYNHLGPSGNYLNLFGPYFTDRYHTPWGDAVNLDGPGSDEVRRFFIDNARMWLRDYHMDGLRLDAVHTITDHSAVHFLEQLQGEVKGLEAHLGRHLVLIAESDLNDPRLLRPVQAGGYGLDAQWSDDFHHALHSLLTGERQGYYQDFGKVRDLAKAVEEVFVYDGRYSAYRNHRQGRPVIDLSGNRFVGYLQNHDQVGNRAQGERSSQIMTAGQLKIAAALVLTSPFIPMLFQGEEWGASTPFLYFSSFQDENLADAVWNGRREEFSAFGWNPDQIPDPQAVETFQRSKLVWEELDRAPHREILEWHRQLIQLRKRLPSLTDGDLDAVRVAYDEEDHWMVVERKEIVVACNLESRSQTIVFPGVRQAEILLASETGVDRHEHSLLLPGHTVVILKR